MADWIGHAELADFADKRVNLPSTEVKKIREQVNTLRDRLADHVAKNPGFALVKMVNGGSVAKGTALRKLNDVDVAVYVRKDDAPNDVGDLVLWMTERLREAYKGLIDPSQVQPGTHCATITFKSTGLQVDVVPVLYEGDPDDRGYLIANGKGERLLTSVRRHLEFIRKRKNACKPHWAQVVRFVKWWAREQANLDGDFKFKSFMIELICAHLQDKGLVKFDDYPTALEGVFDYIVQSELNDRIAFTDYYKLTDLPVETLGAIEVFDPVNPENNVARVYTDDHRKRIVAAAEAALDAIVEASCAVTKAQEVECWQVVLGNRFQG